MSYRSWCRRGGWAALLALPSMLAGCWEDSLFDEDAADRVAIIEDPVLLDQRIEYREERLSIVPRLLATEPDLPRYMDNHDVVGLTLIAEVEPPELDGVRLQATHLALRGERAFVSYNVAGGIAKGAVDAFDRIHKDQPVLRSQVLLGDTDVSAVDFRDGQALFLATGVLDGAYPVTAVLEMVPMRNGGRTLDPVTQRIGVPSFVATGVAWANDRVFVTSGDGGPEPGGLSIFDDGGMSLVRFDPFPDARAVVVESGRAVAMKGSPAELRVYDASTGDLVREIFVGGATIPESKSGLAVEGSVAAVAVGEEGVRLVHLESGAILGQLAVPEVPDPDGEVVANAVAIYGDLVFVAHGAGGLWVAQASSRVAVLGPADDAGLSWVGSVQFPDRSSINFVARRGTRLVAAGGLGGLKIIAFDE